MWDDNRVLNLIGTIYVDAVRGVPLIVLAYFIYFGVPAGMQGLGFDQLSSECTCRQVRAALSMNCGAYMAEIIRAGIESVDQRTDGGCQKLRTCPIVPPWLWS